MRKDFKFILCFFLLYLIFVYPFIARPLVADSPAFAREATASLFKGPIFLSHPPLYIDILRFLNQALDLEWNSLRLLGIFCVFLNLILIYQLSLVISGKRGAGLFACFLYAIHPMAIQGSMILDIDNTILTVLTMFFCLYYVKNKDDSNWKNNIFLSLILFICLWAKLSLPLILIFSFLFFSLLNKDKAEFIRLFFIGLVGVLIFLVVWGIDSYVNHVAFTQVFERSLAVIFQKGIKGASLLPVEELIIRTVRVSLWLGLYWVVLWIALSFERLRLSFSKKPKELVFLDFLYLYSWIIFGSYIIIGGTCFGFAKFQYPMLPILAIIASEAVFKLDFRIYRERLLMYVLFGLGFVLISNLFSEDLLYQINYTLRKIAIFSPGEIPRFLFDFSRRIIFYFIPFIVGVFAIVKISKARLISVFKFLAITFIVLGCIFTNIRLIRSDHFTGYCYGREICEFKYMMHFCQEAMEKDGTQAIIAPVDLFRHIDKDRFLAYWFFWNNRDKFLQTVTDKKPEIIISTYTFNAMYTYKNIFLVPQVRAHLEKDYRLVRIGTYDVWLRK